MPSGGKVHKSLRVDAETAERVRALVRDGESEASAYNRVISAGLDAIERGGREDDAADARQDAKEGARDAPGDGTMGVLSETLSALREQLSVMASQLKAKDGQIEAKDEQIRALTELASQSQTIAKQAQALHAVTEAKALPVEATNHGEEEGTARAGSRKRRGPFSRRFGRR